MRTSRPLVRALVRLAAASVLVVAARTPIAGADKVKDNEDLNFEMHVPDEWDWKDPTPFADKFVKAVADRKLAALADKTKEPQGEGAKALLSVQDVPPSFEPDYETWLREWQMGGERIGELQGREQDVPKELEDKQAALLAKIEAALADLAGRKEVLDLLMSRFGTPPTPEIDARNVAVNTIPAAQVDVKGVANNLGGIPANGLGWMRVWVIRKRLYRLVVWVWPTEKDREGLKADRDTIEFGFVILKKEAIPRKPVEPPKGANGGGGPADPNEEKPVGDSAEKKEIDDPARGFHVTKPVKFASEEPDHAKEPGLGFRVDAHTKEGDQVLVDLLVYREGEGFKPDGHLEQIFQEFAKGHVGALETWPFPAVSAKAPFLSLPDPAKKKEIKRPDEKDSVSRGELEKMGVVTQVKNAMVGKEKTRTAWRFCLSGSLERGGKDAWVHYVFGTKDRTYVLRVTIRREGLSTYKPEVEALLLSFQIKEEK